ncbi:MAG: SDR family oxidoreductase [Gemmatimonadota bacterium]
MNELHGKRALVCGSTRGIGRACAEELAALGASVTLVARDGAALDRVKSELGDRTGRVHGFVTADFRDPEGLRAAVAARLEQIGAAHILVNNTGGPPGGPVFQAEPEDFLTAFSQHLLCNQLLVQTLVPGMKASGYGRIINIVSTSVIAPIPGLGVSNTIRAAVANWARTLAHELGPHGITVNNVLPGYTATARLADLMARTAERRGMDPASVEEEWRAGIPLRRFAEPREIAAVVGFLASPGASYLTGVNLPVDGGRTAVQ